MASFGTEIKWTCVICGDKFNTYNNGWPVTVEGEEWCVGCAEGEVSRLREALTRLLRHPHLTHLPTAAEEQDIEFAYGVLGLTKDGQDQEGEKHEAG